MDEQYRIHSHSDMVARMEFICFFTVFCSFVHVSLLGNFYVVLLLSRVYEFTTPQKKKGL